MFGRGKKPAYTYDEETQEPVLRCSICNGEQVAGFKDIRTGRFTEICLIRSAAELERFQKEYGIRKMRREY